MKFLSQGQGGQNFSNNDPGLGVQIVNLEMDQHHVDIAENSSLASMDGTEKKG